LDSEELEQNDSIILESLNQKTAKTTSNRILFKNKEKWKEGDEINVKNIKNKTKKPIS